MSNSQNFTQVLRDLQAQIAKQTSELAAKESELKAIETQKRALEGEIDVKSKQEAAEVKKDDAEIALLKHKIPDLETSHRRVAEELTKIRLTQNSNNLKLLEIQRESQNAMRNQKK